MKPGAELRHVASGRSGKFQWVVAIGTFVIVTCVPMTFTSQARAQSGDLPPGQYQSVVRAKCTTCHVAAQVVAQRRNAGQWAQVVESMILQGAQVTDNEFDQIVMYLANHFGPELVVEESAPRCSSGGHDEN